ncbi:MAG: VWA domain-containing protein [Fibrobacterales bacterium]
MNKNWLYRWHLSIMLIILSFVVGFSYTIETNALTDGSSFVVGGTVVPLIDSNSTGSFLLRARPSAGYGFHRWKSNKPSSTTIDNDSSETTTVMITDSNVVLTAQFLTLCTLTVNAVPGGSVDPSSTVEVLLGVPVSINAYPDTQKIFVSWSSPTYYAQILDPYNPETTVIPDFYGSSCNTTVEPAYGDGYSLTVIDAVKGVMVDSIGAIQTSWVSKSISNPVPYTNLQWFRWSIMSGTMDILDTSIYGVDVSLTSDAVISFDYRYKEMYKVTRFDSTYIFRDHGMGLDTNSSDGVHFYVTGTGSPMRVVLHELAGTVSPGKRLDFYGTDGTYDTLVNSAVDSAGVLIMNLEADSLGVRYYFKVAPDNRYNLDNGFTIHYQEGAALEIISLYGTVQPLHDRVLYTGYDQQLEAQPFAGFDFEKWEIVDAAAHITGGTLTDASITVRPDSNFVIMKAHYKLNAATKPTLILEKPDISDHPRICIEAQVQDTALGAYLPGLDSSNFDVWQRHRDGGEIVNDSSVIFPISVTSQLVGLNVVLVIDESGSMRSVGTSTTEPRIEIARQAVIDFAEGMRPGDKTGLVGFDSYYPPLNGNTFAYSNMTANKDSVISAARNLRAKGGNPLIDGTFKGLEIIKNEQGPKIVLVLGDGDFGGFDYGSVGNSRNGHSFNEVIDTTQKYDIRVFAIGLDLFLLKNYSPGPFVDSMKIALGDSMKVLTDSLGGGVFDNITSANLSNMFNQIRADVKAQYEICYMSPDTTFNGDTNDVAIAIDFFGKNHSDSTWWDESNTPPVVALTDETQSLIGVNNPSGTPLTLSATITDDGGLEYVSLYYRATGTVDFTQLNMYKTQGDTFTVTLPNTLSVFPGIDFYIIAQDSNQLQGKSPKIQYPWSQPYHISIANDPPSVQFDNAFCYENSNSDVSLTGKVWDDEGVNEVDFYYKYAFNPFYTMEVFYPNSDSLFLLEAPLNGYVSLSYYIEVIDSLGGKIRVPNKGDYSVNECAPLSVPQAQLLPDVGGLVISFNDSAYVQFTVAEDVLVDSIKIYYETDSLTEVTNKSRFIYSGDSLLLKSDTHFTMRAVVMNGGYSQSPLGYASFWLDKTLNTPYLELLDSVGVMDSLFTDSIRFIVRSSDSLVPGLKIFFTEVDEAFDESENWWRVNDTITINESHNWLFYGSSPNTLNSDTAQAHWIKDDLFFVTAVDPALSFVSSRIDSLASKDTMHFTAYATLRGSYQGTSYNKIDSVRVLLTNDQNDSLLVWLFETEVNSSIYEAVVPLHLTTMDPVTTDDQLTGRLLPTVLGNITMVTAAYVSDLTIDATMVLETDFVPLNSAVMIDRDRNGYGDGLVLYFEGPVKRLPAQMIEFYWDRVLPEHRYSTSEGQVTYRQENGVIDSTVLFIDLSSVQNEIIGTGNISGEAPYVMLPSTLDLGGVQGAIGDKVSPIVSSIAKIPGAPDDRDILTGMNFNPERFHFTFTEPIVSDSLVTLSEWSTTFLLDRGCTGVGDIQSFSDLVQVDSLGMEWEVVITENPPVVGDCFVINLDTNAITDSQGNGIAIIELSITGTNRGKPTSIGVMDDVTKSIDPLLLPENIDPIHSTILAIHSDMAFTADVNIFDMFGSFVANVKYNGVGEYFEVGQSQYIVWNKRDRGGRKVGSGVYIWDVHLTYNDGSQGAYIVKSAVLR